MTQHCVAERFRSLPGCQTKQFSGQILEQSQQENSSSLPGRPFRSAKLNGFQFSRYCPPLSFSSEPHALQSLCFAFQRLNAAEQI